MHTCTLGCARIQDCICINYYHTSLASILMKTIYNKCMHENSFFKVKGSTEHKGRYFDKGW